MFDVEGAGDVGELVEWIYLNERIVIEFWEKSYKYMLISNYQYLALVHEKN